MIIYKNTKTGFIDDVKTGNIADLVQRSFETHGIHHNSEGEFRAWSNSLLHMRNVLDDDDIPNDVTLAIEYQIPLTSRRVDFLLAGKDENDKNNVVVIELKQWENSGITPNPEIVTAYTGGKDQPVCHPSYQAYSYAKIIENFNVEVNKLNVSLDPCAYLHNYKEENRKNICHPSYKDIINLAPVFIKNDLEHLRSFIKKFIKKKDGIDLLMKIDDGKLKPSKALQDAIVSMIEGNHEFYLIDEQKVAYETVKTLVRAAVRNANDPQKGNEKGVIIISGGPGTGKSVIALKLLSDLIRNGRSATYVTKNKAPRDVYFEKMYQGDYTQKYIKTLLKSPVSFEKSRNNIFDCIIVDEAHRLMKHYGHNQIDELIESGKVVVFFIDEDQRVTVFDEGTKCNINNSAKSHEAHVYDEIELVSQFRCNGSDSYLKAIDNILGIRKTDNDNFKHDYDVKLFYSPTVMREALREKNAINNKSRMIAGYCYEWKTKFNPNGEEHDIELEDNFKAKWNFYDTIFAIDPNSFDQVGCIHSTQGLEFDYCGIIIGKDLRYENDQVITDQSMEAKSDNTSGIRTCRDTSKADTLIRNTYKTLLTRGQKGCFIYCEDKPLIEHISEVLRISIIK